MTSTSILIVDHDTTMAEMFRLMLEREGYRTFIVDGDYLAVNAIRREKPNLVLLDTITSEITGIDLCGFIRREPDMRDLPIILVSARKGPGDVEAGLAAGATVFLLKPVSRHDLIAGVKQALNESN